MCQLLQAHSEVQMETKDEFLNLRLIRIGNNIHHKKDHIKITGSQFTTFEVLLLDCNHVKGFQILEKLGTLYGFEGCCLC